MRRLIRSCRDLAAALWVAPRMERLRRIEGPLRAVEFARGAGRGLPARSPGDRLILRRAVSLVDSWIPGGPNCFRRCLMEMALDAGAAREKLLAGIQSGGGHGTGHAWLESHPTDRSYDAVFPI
jgi:hypothetical protein